MILRQAKPEELDAVCALYEQVSREMEEQGLHQWHWGDYPNRDLIREDIERGELYCLYGAPGMVMAVTVTSRKDEAYDEINWLFGINPGSFYRLAVHKTLQAEGYGSRAIEDVEEILRQRGCDAVRCDTYCENSLSIKLFARLGMRQAGKA